MSIAVPLEELRAQIDSYSTLPYLLTVSDDGRPHCVGLPVEWNDDELVMTTGRRTHENAAARRAVSLLWPPNEVGGYSLILDGAVTSTEDPGDGLGDLRLTVRPERAVLHRPRVGEGASANACGAECVPILDA